MNGENSLWVFGYGSLCWFPGFEYGDSVLGHIDGYSRRFWQGNTTHRGTEDKVRGFLWWCECVTGSHERTCSTIRNLSFIAVENETWGTAIK